MNEFWWGAIVAIPAGLLGGSLAVILVAFLIPRKKCPQCGELLPRMRNSWGWSRVMWICPGCGCRLDRKANRVKG
jgi:hypothetical protein